MSSTGAPELVPLTNDDGSPMQLSQMEAIAMQTLLASDGIAAEVTGYWAEPVLPFRVMISSAQREQAARIVAEAQACGAEMADAAEQAGEAAGDTAPEDANIGYPGIL